MAPKTTIHTFCNCFSIIPRTPGSLLVILNLSFFPSCAWQINQEVNPEFPNANYMEMLSSPMPSSAGAAYQRRRSASEVSTPQNLNHVSHFAREAPHFLHPSSLARNNSPSDLRSTSSSTPSRSKVSTVVEDQRFSQYVGVCWNRRARKWAAQSRVDGRTIYLGYFSDEEEAARK